MFKYLAACSLKDILRYLKTRYINFSQLTTVNASTRTAISHEVADCDHKVNKKSKEK